MIGPQHLIFGTDSMPQQLPTLDRRSMLAMRHLGKSDMSSKAKATNCARLWESDQGELGK